MAEIDSGHGRYLDLLSFQNKEHRRSKAKDRSMDPNSGDTTDTSTVGYEPSKSFKADKTDKSTKSNDIDEVGSGISGTSSPSDSSSAILHPDLDPKRDPHR